MRWLRCTMFLKQIKNKLITHFQNLCRKIANQKETPKLIETRQFKHFNALRFQDDLSEAFSTFSTFSDPNKAWETWKEIFLEIENKHAPLRQRRVKSEYC